MQTSTSNPSSDWFQAQKSFIDETFSNLGKFGKLSQAAEKAQRIKKGVTPSEMVYEVDHIQLRRYLPKAPELKEVPLILVFALVNRPYILDLKEGRSVISHFVDRGFDTYLIDWGKPRDCDRDLGFEEYIDGYLLEIIDEVRRRTGSEKVNILGYCMGGTMSSMFTALYPDRVKNLILMAAGIDYSDRESLLSIWTDPEYFDVDSFIHAFGNCPPEFLQASFLMLKPIQNLIEKPINFWEQIDNDKYVDDFLSMETWLNDNIPVPGKIYSQFVKCLYQHNMLTENKMRVGKRLVELKNITCPVLNLMAQFDDLVPCGQSAPFNDLIGSSDRQSMMIKAGHIGLAVGSKAQREMWPKVCDWLESRL